MGRTEGRGGGRKEKCECIFASLGDLQVYMVISIRHRPSRFTGSLDGGGSSGGRTKTSMVPPASEEDAAYHFKGPVSVTGMDRELKEQTNKQTRVRLNKTRSCCSSVRLSVPLAAACRWSCQRRCFDPRPDLPHHHP